MHTAISVPFSYLRQCRVITGGRQIIRKIAKMFKMFDILFKIALNAEDFFFFTEYLDITFSRICKANFFSFRLIYFFYFLDM